MSHLFVLVCRHELHSKWTGLLKSAKFYSRKGRADLCLLLITCLFFGREFLPWNNCVQNTSHLETDKLFRYKHGHVRLAVFNFPVSTQYSPVIHGMVLACWWWLRSSLIEKQAEKRDYKQLECEQPLGMVVWVSKSSEANTEKNGKKKCQSLLGPFTLSRVPASTKLTEKFLAVYWRLELIPL